LSVDFLSPNHPFWGLLNVGVGMASRHRVCQPTLCCYTKIVDKLNFWCLTLYVICLASLGLTKTCTTSFIQVPNMISMNGTMGPPNMPNIDVCLESVSKLNYDVFNTTSPQGRICIHGSSLFSSYYKHKNLTKKVPIRVKTCIRNQKGRQMLNIINQNQTFFLLPFKNIITMAS